MATLGLSVPHVHGTTFPTDPGLAPHVRAAQPLLSFPGIPEVFTLPLAGSAYVDLINVGKEEFGDSDVTQFWTSLVPATPAQNFAATWAGGFDVHGPGNYTFCITSDGGFTLFIGTTRVVNKAITAPSLSAACGTTSLSAGSHAVSAHVFYGPSGVSALIDATYAGPDTGGAAVLF